MRFDSCKLISGTIFVAALAAGQMIAAPATAGKIKERIYGDSFGNLVIYSPAGYKRIVVGRGYIADELAAAEAEQNPPVIYDEGGRESRNVRYCYYKPMFWRGRDRMYGLPDGEVPTPPRICR